jgi:predicted hotdog family 3-hydroxylacyl-ACP dehydratase
MILLDRLVESKGRESTCEVTIGPHSMFVETAGVPAFVGIEYMAQAVAAHGGYQSYQAGEPIAVGLLLGTRHVKLHGPFFELGQTLRIHVIHTWGERELMRFRCAITPIATGTLLQQAELNVFKPTILRAYLEEAGHDNTRTGHRR